MMARTRMMKMFLAAFLRMAAVITVAAPAFAQYTDDWGTPAYDNSWNTPGRSSVRPVSSSDTQDFPELPPAIPRGGSLDWRTNNELTYDRSGGSFGGNDRYAPIDRPLLRDPFRRNNSDGMNDRNDNVAPQSRYRIPLDRSNNGQNSRDNSWDAMPTDFDRFNSSRSNSDFGRDGGRYEPLNGRDPFVPAPQPNGRVDDETETINKLITIRYQNPVNVRAVRAMSANQAIQLFAEVSQKIDERHLEPSTYDLRVRRGLRNLAIALDNPAFVTALGISTDSFRTDSFRNALSAAAGNLQVRTSQDARNVVVSIMQQAQSVSGLTPSVVAFEFANASMDTLDKFSGLEPADPQGVPGASLPSGAKSAALEEEIVGVGVEVKEDANGLLVVKALRGGPAAEAGLESGDVIVAINGRSISGMKMASSVDLMKGTSGSSMTVRIFRQGRGERDFALTRRKVRVWTVNDTRLLEGTNVAYLSLSRFSQNSTAELDQALADLHRQGMKSLIIDLRGNPGGLLTTCVEISDRFLPCGTIVSTKGRLASDNMQETATRQKTWATPLVVLIDGDSASASEIFAAAVQENGRGVVVGTRSYGKGTVQTHFPLNAVTGNLRLTTARFYSPSGRPMAGEGVTPDVSVNDADGVANGDLVLERALQIAGSPRLQEMAKAAGTCRTGTSAGPRSSSLSNINDPAISGTMIR